MSAATKDTLCNLALSFLGEPSATPFTGGTTIRDIQCAAHYEGAKNDVFTHHRWSFATALHPITLASPQPTHVPSHLPHAYTLPTAFLRFHEIRLSNGHTLDTFTILGNHLYLDHATAIGHILYTTSALEPEAMPPIASECVAYALAIRIGEVLTQSPQKVEQLRAHLAQAYARAITTDARQTSSNENSPLNSLLTSTGTYLSRFRRL